MADVLKTPSLEHDQSHNSKKKNHGNSPRCFFLARHRSVEIARWAWGGRPGTPWRPALVRPVLRSIGPPSATNPAINRKTECAGESCVFFRCADDEKKTRFRPFHPSNAPPWVSAPQIPPGRWSWRRGPFGPAAAKILGGEKKRAFPLPRFWWPLPLQKRKIQKVVGAGAPPKSAILQKCFFRLRAPSQVLCPPSLAVARPPGRPLLRPMGREDPPPAHKSNARPKSPAYGSPTCGVYHVLILGHFHSASAVNLFSKPPNKRKGKNGKKREKEKRRRRMDLEKPIKCPQCHK